ncbi:hypothetical protein [Mucilaginibacter sp. UYCu711]|uniref:hypothetical protein n=1 Tax=Mucilaginibacter sp. UYCu711 TaxID=3156339 RepID=UPI003D257AA9
MQCQLCLQEKNLLKKSHIFPNFLYKNIFGEEHRLVNINLGNFDDFHFTHSGFYDKEILCRECDGTILSRLETYASNKLYFNGSERSRSEVRTELLSGGDAVPAIRFHNMDYAKIKLFLLSLLWRTHISKQAFFKEVQLGPYAEKLRRMLLNHDAGKEDEFEVILMHIDSKKTRPEKGLFQPRQLRIDGNYQYAFYIDRIIYHYNISPHNKSSIYTKGIVKNDGIFDICLLTDAMARSYFDSILGQRITLKSNPVK